jgi:hypothetical protein
MRSSSGCSAVRRRLRKNDCELLNVPRRLDSEQGFLSGFTIDNDVLAGMEQNEPLEPNLGIIQGLGRPLEDWLTCFNDTQNIKRPRHVGVTNTTAKINRS